jgi:ubiquitin-conjugating enzyme E2 variant
VNRLLGARERDDAARAPLDPGPPAHYAATRSQLFFSGLSIAAAFLLLAALGVRIATRFDLSQWWVPLAFLGGIAAADFGSGLIHWSADTWGRDDLPVIGHRLLVPFRVHHVNPEDFLRRRFVDTNGDVAFLAVLVLLGFLVVPLETAWGGPVAVFGVAFCGIGMMTNQIHQWAHMPSPPPPIRALQRCRLVLGRAEHAAHHDRPYDRQYCITTGWCNRPLEAIGFFRRAEAAITRVTGARPRHDDRRYEERYGVPVRPAEPRDA